MDVNDIQWCLSFWWAVDTDLLGQEELLDGDESCDEQDEETDEEGSLIHLQAKKTGRSATQAPTSLLVTGMKDCLWKGSRSRDRNRYRNRHQKQRSKLRSFKFPVSASPGSFLLHQVVGVVLGHESRRVLLSNYLLQKQYSRSRDGSSRVIQTVEKQSSESGSSLASFVQFLVKD